MKLPDWWAEAPRWEHREVDDHYRNESDVLTSSFLKEPVPYEEALARRRRGEPLEYILRHCHVDNVTLKTDQRALVPRPETETLVRCVVDRVSDMPSGTLLDCGTGSGFIAGWLRRNTGRPVVGSDCSEPALQLARENCELNDWSIPLVRADRAAPFVGLAGVVANLPYVRRDSSRLSESVKQYEPAEALFPEGTPLKFYREFVLQLEECLSPGGEAWLELEPRLIADLRDWIANRSLWQDVEVLRDQSDSKRFLHLVVGDQSRSSH